MKIRKAKLSDIPIIQEIANKAWRPTYGHILTEQQSLYMLDLMYNNITLTDQINGDIKYFIVEDGQDLAGYFSIENMDNNLLKLHKLYFDPIKKKLGFGSKVIKFIIDLAKDQKMIGIKINVNKKNSAVYFYEKMGFTIVEELILNIGEGYVMDDYIMELDLELTRSNA